MTSPMSEWSKTEDPSYSLLELKNCLDCLKDRIRGSKALQDGANNTQRQDNGLSIHFIF